MRTISGYEIKNYWEEIKDLYDMMQFNNTMQQNYNKQIEWCKFNIKEIEKKIEVIEGKINKC